MNNKQRTILKRLAKEVEDSLTAIAEQIEEMAYDENSKFDELPEGLQEAPVGEALDESSGRLNEVEYELREQATLLQEMILDAGEIPR